MATLERNCRMCQVCSESWPHKSLRILPCKHISCIECLYQLQGAYLVECAVCHKDAVVPGRDVDNFPVYKATFKHQKNLIKVKKSSCPCKLSYKCYITNEGLYSISTKDLRTILFKPSFDGFILPICLNKEISDFAITDNYIYAVENSTGKILSSTKPFEGEINLRLYSSNRVNSLKAIEDENGDSCIIGFLECRNKCLFIHKSIYRWSSLNCKSIECILPNGNPIIKTCDNKFVILDKLKGKPLNELKCKGLSQVCNFSPHGILLAQTSFDKYRKYYEDNEYQYRYTDADDDMDQNEEYGISNKIIKMELFLYDYNFKLIRKLNDFKRAKLIGTAKNGNICLLFVNGKMKTYEWK
ncbi:unnamed protein product [Dimorphilus gyrociliatus]|uniref:RING-type domain-containing protein n=1 Tax=Dimorphilus gyrociliatus TaxID=2664684 RepID=A0A7I8VEM9_9ANNE|nr:unnamed protein product [Dimorphilus gyrociliatus]